ncbi:MAG: ABC transporter ATP-binding protein [Alphaproteobacteria bacterium]|nr:ABC transporter ATP-binding protein [Alphaproteobacteria bacterium]
MAPPDTDVLATARDLSIGYADALGRTIGVVDRVGFRLSAGEALGIVGESGSGKSTLARALLGYRRAGGRFLGGALEFGGVDLARADRATVGRLRGIEVAMVPQNPLSSLTYHMRVGAQIEEVLRTRAGHGRAAARARALELLGAMGLPEPAAIARRYPHQLSGGQRQRVVIAAALACRPKLLVLDEPTTALDKTTEVQVLDLVVRLRRELGTTLVLVTHDLNVVAQVCDRVLVMKDGAVVEEGVVRDVFASPRTAYARTLLDATLRLDAGPAAAAPAAAPILSIEKLGFVYDAPRWFGLSRSPARPALTDIDVAVGRGEVLGVIGESGSGKTTLGLIVAGMMGASRGRIDFEGTSLAPRAAQRPADVRRRIQMVFQDPLSSLNPRHTVGAAIIRPLRRFFGLDRRAARARAAALLQELGMGETYLDRYPRQLSGGQQQRVAIARAFAAEPDLLVCDEITSALDASIQAQVLDHLLALQRRSGASMIVITHDLAVIWKMARRVIVLRHGRIVEAGETAEVFAAPRDPYTARLLEAATRATRATAPSTAVPQDAATP